MNRILVGRSTAARLRALEESLAAAPAAAEQLLIGASREAVDDLARRGTLLTAAQFGLHRMSWRQLVGQLAAPGLAEEERAPASGLSTEALAARTAHQARAKGQLPRLETVSRFPGFPRALASTLVELQEADVDTEALAAQPEMATLLQGFTHNVDFAALAPYPALLAYAADGLQLPHLQAQLQRPLFLLDLDLRSRRERRLLQQICSTAPQWTMTLPERDAQLEEALNANTTFELVDLDAGARHGRTRLEQLRRHLFSDTVPDASAEDDTVHFFSAPGEGRESIEIARLILDSLSQGFRFDEIAVLTRAPEVYGSLLDTAFRRAQVPAYFARGSRRPDPSGRAFLALLTCATEGLSARRFAEYLSFAQVPQPDEDGRPPTGGDTWAAPTEELFGNASGVAADAGKTAAATRPGASTQLSLWGDDDATLVATPQSPEADAVAGEEDVEDPFAHFKPPGADQATRDGVLQAPWKWEEYLVEAAVIGSRDRWQRRLTGLANELKLKATELAQIDPESPRLRVFRRDLEQLQHLERFALPIIEALDAFPEECTWGEWITHLQQLAPRVLRSPQRVLGILQELSPMSSIGPTSLAEVREVLMTRLSTLEAEPPASRYGRVFVAPPEMARGRSFRLVFVPGLAERIFPQRPREDPLLLDHVRQNIDTQLTTQDVRAHRERLLLQLAVGAAEERVVLSYPRIDAAEARPRVPSFYGLDVMRATQGTLPDLEAFERQAAQRVQARLAWPAPDDPRRAIDAVEHDLAVIGPLLHDDEPELQKGAAHYLLDLNEHLARSLRARWLKWSRKWTPADGIVRATEHTKLLLENEALDQRAYSVTALQRFSTCPYQFLLSAIHRLEPRRDAVPLAQMDPLTRGRMIHEVQARTLDSLRQRDLIPLQEEAAQECRDVLDAILSEIAQRYHDDLAPPILRVWQDEVDAMRADLRIWLRNLAAQKDWKPTHFELAFGLPERLGHAEPRDPASRPEPASLQDDWLIRGAIDMVEESADGSALRVTDHKTGSNRTMPGMTVAGGEILQPLLYGLALEAIVERPVREGRLSFCTARGQFSEHNVPLGDLQRNWAGIVLEIINRSILKGALPPAPKEDGCRFCDFRVVCGPHEERRARNKNEGILVLLKELRSLP